MDLRLAPPCGERHPRYRLTFDPAPAVKNAGEKVVLTGEESLSINGRLYSTPEEVPFEQVVEVFDGKFEYFSAA